MKANSVIDKYKYYFNKRLQIFVNGLQPSKIEGRKKGPKVVLNSLPKSGTHLLENLFFKLPYMRHCGRKTLTIETQNPIQTKLQPIKKLKRGQFLLGHMQYHDSILKCINENNVILIQLIRDPRDVLISHLNYIETMDKTQKSHAFISNFHSKEDKIKAMIEGKPNILEPFSEVLEKFSPWLSKKDVLSLKFEDLIGENGGGSQTSQYETVKSICEFCGFDFTDEKIKSIAKEIYSTKSSTFNKGKIGNWKNALNTREQDLLNKHIEDNIIRFGYTI